MVPAPAGTFLIEEGWGRDSRIPAHTRGGEVPADPVMGVIGGGRRPAVPKQQ